MTQFGVTSVSYNPSGLNTNDVSYPSVGHLSPQLWSAHVNIHLMHTRDLWPEHLQISWFTTIKWIYRIILRSWQMLHIAVSVGPDLNIDGVLMWLKQFWVYGFDMSTSWQGATLPFPLAAQLYKSGDIKLMRKKQQGIKGCCNITTTTDRHNETSQSDKNWDC